MGKPNPERTISDLGHRVRELRRARGWVQDELAERWGVSLGYVKSVEAGRENLTVRSLALLAHVLGANPSELLTAPRARPKRRPGRPRSRD